jgi:aconitate hydratase
MGAECGVTTSIFPSDAETRKFLAAQGREAEWKELKADPKAQYSRVVNLDLPEIEPMIALPHSPGNVKRVKEVAGLPVDQVCIGSCTNSSFRDLMVVARIMRGKAANPNVSFVLAPGSKQVLDMISRNGALGILIETGARLQEAACGFCIGNSQSPASAAVSLRTSNRNFEGRSGTRDAQVFLVSPETAAAAIIAGKITDPRDLGMRYPSVRMPGKFLIDDSMIIRPRKDDSAVEIIRGPNIGEPPKNEPMPPAIMGTVTIKVGDKITTDHIIPAGARMKFRSNVPEYSRYLFEVVDPKFFERAKRLKEAGRHNVIVSGISYGQGSSREHAALCPMYMGVKAVIAKSFERIHSDNLINFGILPLVFRKEADYERIEPDDQLEIAGLRDLIRIGAPLVVKNVTRNFDFQVSYKLSERQKEIVLAGGTLNLMKK